jgi:hypothetical protein
LRRSEEELKSELRSKEAQIKAELDRDTNIKIETLKSDNSTLQSFYRFVVGQPKARYGREARGGRKNVKRAFKNER